MALPEQNAMRLYRRKWALVVGIDRYASAAPLNYATNDALGFKQVLLQDFGFDEVVELVDEGATRQGVLSAFHRFQEAEVEEHDCVVFFFAGHGHTHQSFFAGQIGFLVPFDGQPNRPGTLVRWAELIDAAELIAARHVLFIMDACYGGLALQRSAPGKRFLADVLARRAHQVLTAGKADQTVSDSGGPIAGHSVFTGHLLQGLAGRAAAADGILTANGLMAYVYGEVSKDHGSRQTPSFGHVRGDGDLVFRGPEATSAGIKPAEVVYREHGPGSSRLAPVAGAIAGLVLGIAVDALTSAGARTITTADLAIPNCIAGALLGWVAERDWRRALALLVGVAISIALLAALRLPICMVQARGDLFNPYLNAARFGAAFGPFTALASLVLAIRARARWRGASVRSRRWLEVAVGAVIGLSATAALQVTLGFDLEDLGAGNLLLPGAAGAIAARTLGGGPQRGALLLLLTCLAIAALSLVAWNLPFVRQTPLPEARVALSLAVGWQFGSLVGVVAAAALGRRHRASTPR